MSTLRWSAAMVVLVTSCAPRGPVAIDVSDYRTECEMDDDCVIAATVKCAHCVPCAGPAISRVDYEEYRKKYERTACRPPEGPPPTCSPCQVYEAVCTDGQCAARLAQ